MPTANRQLPTALFDRKRLAMHRARAGKRFHDHDFLLLDAESRLEERLEEFNRTFEKVLHIGGAPDKYHDAYFKGEYELLDATENHFDLVLGKGDLHWVNDLPGALIQIRRALKPGGLFIGLLPGRETLRELRESLAAAEMDVCGGISPRISPFIDAQAGASLLSRAGFAMPVADSDVFHVHYKHPRELLHDLRGMGEANALIESRKHFTPRALFEKMYAYYQEHFPAPKGKVAASFEAVALTGFKPE